MCDATFQFSSTITLQTHTQGHTDGRKQAGHQDLSFRWATVILAGPL